MTKLLRKRGIGDRFERNGIELICRRIVLHLLTTDAGPYAVNIFQITFHIGAVHSVGETGPCAVLLNTGCGVDDKTRTALMGRFVQRVAKGVTGDSHIIGLVKVVVF